MRATHPFLLLLPLLAAALIALNPLTAVAADLVFPDSTTVKGVTIALKEAPTMTAQLGCQLPGPKLQSLPPLADLPR